MELFAQEIFERAGTWYERMMHPAIMVPFCIFGLPIIVWGIKSVLTASSQAKVIETELQLKRELVAQGRSAEEIERIMGNRTNGRQDA